MIWMINGRQIQLVLPIFASSAWEQFNVGAKFMPLAPWLMWLPLVRCTPTYFGSLEVPFKYVFIRFCLDICQNMWNNWAGCAQTGMLLNWFHPALDWLCTVPPYTIQALTEGATAPGLTDHMPPLAGSDWRFHWSMILSDVIFGWIALFPSHCWLPIPEELSLQSSARWVALWRTWLSGPEENLSADELARTSQTSCLWMSMRLF